MNNHNGWILEPKKYRLDRESNPNWVFMTSYWINYITYNRGEEKYERENENIE